MPSPPSASEGVSGAGAPAAAAAPPPAAQPPADSPVEAYRRLISQQGFGMPVLPPRAPAVDRTQHPEPAAANALHPTSAGAAARTSSNAAAASSSVQSELLSAAAADAASAGAGSSGAGVLDGWASSLPLFTQPCTSAAQCTVRRPHMNL